MASLYGINQEIMDCIDLETGEIINPEKLEELQLSKAEKLENIALLYKNSVAEASAYKAEKDTFAQREKSAKNTAEWCKKVLASELNGKPWKTDKFAISYRKSEVVEITDIKAVPDAFLIPVDPKVDKTGLKKAIKAGAMFDGIELVEKQNIQVK